jgi:hypothetical protein
MYNCDSHHHTPALSALLIVFGLRSTVYGWGTASKLTFIASFRERNIADFDLKRRQTDLLSRLSERQGSSVVEQGTHKPLVGSSNLPPGMGSSAYRRDAAV